MILPARCKWSVWLWSYGLCSQSQSTTGMEELLCSGRESTGGGYGHAYSRGSTQVGSQDFTSIILDNLPIAPYELNNMYWISETCHFCSCVLIRNYWLIISNRFLKIVWLFFSVPDNYLSVFKVTCKTVLSYWSYGQKYCVNIHNCFVSF